MTKLSDKWDPIVSAAFTEVLRDFYQPLVPKDVVLEDRLDGCGTAFFDFVTNRTHMAREFLEQMSVEGGIEEAVVARGVAKHELGHYLHYPRECAKLMFLKHFAQGTFSEFADSVLAYWVDVMDNTPQVLKEKTGSDVRQLYRGINTLVEKGLSVPEEVRKMLPGIDFEKIADVLRKYSVDRLLAAYYQEQGREDLGVKIDQEYFEKYQKHLKEKKRTWVPNPDKQIEEKLAELYALELGNQEDKECSIEKLLAAYYQTQGTENPGAKIDQEYFEQYRQHLIEKRRTWVPNPEKCVEENLVKLMTIDFTNTDFTNTASEIINFVQFGTIVKDMQKKLKEELEPLLPKNAGGQGKGEGQGSDILEKLLKPIIADAPSLGDFSDDQIEEGLDKIIRQWGKKRYEMILDHVEKETGKKYNRLEETKARSLSAGLESSQIEFHDQEIPYYKRLSFTYGCYIHRRPIVVDTVSSYPEGNTKFRVGDPVKLLNPFSTGGKIMPGVTKRHKQRQGTKRDRQFKVPDLTIWLDSSGSMKSPREGSEAIISAYVLARNYYENGSKVGVANFSADTAFLMPTREIEDVYSILTAYWGGGTVLNIEKIKQYMQMIAGKEEKAMPYYTTEDDYKRLIEGMHPETRKEFLEKHLEVSLKGALRETYEKMDNIMITDGGISNITEVVEFMNSTAEVTRNVILLTGPKSMYEEWSKLDLPNTQIVLVEKKEDLYGLAIGEVKKMAPQKERPASLFQRT